MITDVAASFDSCFATARHIVLAVSGGPDSTALMHLAVEWRAMRTGSLPSLSVATVDHRLRAGSDAEARQVAAAAQDLGLDHATLVWAGTKPSAGLQAAAREARLLLLAEHVAACRADAVAMAHTADDQAETVLMRLARGSGVDGLAGMRPVARVGSLVILRPLLGVRKAALEATLRARGIAWVADPSNDLEKFERVRWRKAEPVLAEAGLSTEAIVRSARRLERAAEALEFATDAMFEPSRGIVHIDRLGFAELDWRRLLGTPAELRLRLIARLIGIVGGRPEAPSMKRLEALTEGRAWQPPHGATLGGVAFRCKRDRIVLMREPGRRPPQDIVIAPGAKAMFDGRFEVCVSDRVPRSVRVTALAARDLARLDELDVPRPDAPALILRALPALWLGERLAAVPLLGYVAEDLSADQFSAVFTGCGVQR